VACLFSARTAAVLATTSNDVRTIISNAQRLRVARDETVLASLAANEYAFKIESAPEDRLEIARDTCVNH
jgi:hypothetical protein